MTGSRVARSLTPRSAELRFRHPMVSTLSEQDTSRAMSTPRESRLRDTRQGGQPVGSNYSHIGLDQVRRVRPCCSRRPEGCKHAIPALSSDDVNLPRPSTWALRSPSSSFAGCSSESDHVDVQARTAQPLVSARIVRLLTVGGALQACTRRPRPAAAGTRTGAGRRVRGRYQQARPRRRDRWTYIRERRCHRRLAARRRLASAAVNGLEIPEQRRSFIVGAPLICDQPRQVPKPRVTRVRPLL